MNNLTGHIFNVVMSVAMGYLVVVLMRMAQALKHFRELKAIPGMVNKAEVEAKIKEAVEAFREDNQDIDAYVQIIEGVKVGAIEVAEIAPGVLVVNRDDYQKMEQMATLAAAKSKGGTSAN